jgi:NAD(P)-dependent dehydrogenase (short-subunit alcohol dehydrogenase family)
MREDRVALVTGAGRGLGRAHALALAANGAAVVVNDVDVGPAEAVAAEVRAAGGRAVADGTDVASIAGGGRAVAVAIDTFGRIDILVNNAGFAHGGGSVEQPVVEELDALVDVHLKAAVGTMAAALVDMRGRGWGRIVNTVSEASLDPRFVASLGYGLAKAALWSATLVAAVEAAPYGVTVNAISPGARTRLNAEVLDAGFRSGASAGLDLDPAHVAAVVAYLASDEAGDITGRVIHAAGGHVREYSTVRTSDSDLVRRLQAVLGSG